MTPVSVDALRSHRFLDGLAEDALRLLASHAEAVHVPSERRLFREGDPATMFWLITDGLVAIDVHAPGRGDVLIETLGPGEVLGWSWLFPPHRWHLGAVARGPVEAFRLPADAVLAEAAQRPDVGYELMRRFAVVVVERLQATRMRLLDLYAAAPPRDVSGQAAHG